MRVVIVLLLVGAVAVAKKSYSDLDEKLKLDKLDEARSLNGFHAEVQATAALREQYRRENAEAQRAWEEANPDLVAEHKRKLASQSTSAALDANALASQLQQAGLVKKDDKALELAQQFALDKARNKGGDVYEQEVDGRVVEFRAQTSKPDTQDICQTNPEMCRGSLGIPRWAMPQFKQEGAKTNFLETAKKLGYSVEQRRVKLGDLAVVQSEVLASKAKGFQEKFADKKELEEYQRKGTPVIGGQVLDGHHHFAAALRAAGPNTEIAAEWITRRDKSGKEVALSREDKLKLWRASIETKGVTREDLAPSASATAAIQRSFRRSGAKRTRKGEAGYDYRREYVMNLWRNRRQNRAGLRVAGVASAADKRRLLSPARPARVPAPGASYRSASMLMKGKGKKNKKNKKD